MKPMRPKLYHKAAALREDGAVTALCFSSPRPIDLKVALWTIRDDAVTCPRCRKALAEKEASAT